MMHDMYVYVSVMYTCIQLLITKNREMDDIKILFYFV